MKMQASSDSFLFEEFRLDRLGGGLFRRDDQGAFVPVAIGSRALDILTALIERRRYRFEGRNHRRRLAPDGGRGK